MLRNLLVHCQRVQRLLLCKAITSTKQSFELLHMWKTKEFFRTE